MKTLKTLSVLLLMATTAMAQWNPDNMFISGYVTDSNGMAVNNQQVCVTFESNVPILPSDTVCVSTNNNGYYAIEIVNGSVTGPNVTYTVSTYDSCSFVALSQDRDNYQGTIDTANVNFSICANSVACDVSFTYYNDSINGTWVFEATPSGTPPFIYNWWIDGSTHTTQTVTHVFNSNSDTIVSVSITDANGCTSSAIDTLTLHDNSNTTCSAWIQTSIDSFGISTLEAHATGVGPFSYVWSNGQTTPSIMTELAGIYCLEITDATGCVSATCDTIVNTNSCSVEITTTVDSSGGGLVYTLTASGGFTQYVWDNNQTGQSITVEEPGPNDGIFCVVATDANNCTATACDTLPWYNDSCYVSITADGTLTMGSGVTLTAHGSGPGPYSYLWSHSGETTAIVNVSVPGNYCVEVTNADGCLAYTCISVSGNACQAGFSYPSGPNGELLVEDSVLLYFNGVAGNSSTYSWTLTAGGLSFTATGMNPTIAIPPTLLPVNGMNVEICVTVTDSLINCTNTYCETVLAVPNNGNNQCQADFSASIDTSLNPQQTAVQFTDQSFGPATYWYWEFGNGSTSTEQNPLHIFNGNGPFIVCLTITTANQQCQSTYCDTLYLDNTTGNCNASFITTGPTGIGYSFSANVQDSSLHYQWTINNQLIGDGYDMYTPGFANGTHTVCLTVIDSLNNCTDTQCETITVGPNACNGYVSGQVFAGTNNQPLNNGTVYLILHDQASNTLTAIDSMVLDSGNWYFFGPLDCGNYLIKAAANSNSPYYANYIPTYYGNSPFWGFAQPVSLTLPNTQATADVLLISASNPGGPGFIGGHVSQGANKTDEGDPLSHMQVMLFDMNGNAIAYTYTDANGAFGFNNLAYGTYQVYVEALGVQTIPAVVTIGPDDPSVENVHIWASESLISTGIQGFDFDGAISEVHPNPVLHTAFISLNLEAGVALNIAILDLTGRIVATQSATIASGKNTISINAENLKEGYYFLNMQDIEGRFSITRKFMRVD